MKISLLFWTGIISNVLHVYADACNDIAIGNVWAYTSPAQDQCGVDPKGGSLYGIPVQVNNPCKDGQILYMSFDYTAPGGSVTRTVQAATLGPAAASWTTTYKLDILNSQLAKDSLVSQTYQFDDSPPATTVITTHREFSTLVSLVSTPQSASFTIPLTTVPTTQVYTETVISPAQVTNTAQCTYGTNTETVYVTTTAVQTTTLPPDQVFSTLSLTVTQSLHCTKAGGGIPSDFAYKSGIYEGQVCGNYIGHLYGTTFYTETAPTHSYTLTLGAKSVYSWAYSDTTVTVAPSPATTGACDGAPTVTVTSTRTRTSHVLFPTTRATTTTPYNNYVTVTVAPSVC